MAFTGDLTRFEGSMLRGHKDGSANDATAGGESKPGGWVSNTTTATGIRPPQSATHGDDNCRGLTGQKAEVRFTLHLYGKMSGETKVSE